MNQNVLKIKILQDKEPPSMLKRCFKLFGVPYCGSKLNALWYKGRKRVGKEGRGGGG